MQTELWQKIKEAGRAMRDVIYATNGKGEPDKHPIRHAGPRISKHQASKPGAKHEPGRRAKPQQILRMTQHERVVYLRKLRDPYYLK
jgi:hypothetical protein